MTKSQRHRVVLAGLGSALALAAGGVAAQESSGPERAAITVGTLGNPFFQVVIAGATDRIEEANPDAQITTVGADYDLNEQSSQIDSFIAGGAQLLILNAVDQQAVGPAVERAKQSGMTVAAVDVSAAGADLTVMTNNVQAGRITCEYLAEQIGGEGNFIIINGPPVSSITDRVQGCHEALENYPDIELLSDNQDGQASRDGGFQVMQNLLTRFSEIDAVFGANDPTAIGAQLAAQQFGRTEMVIGGVDGSPDFVDAMNQDSTLLVASASQDPYGMARQAADMGIQMMNGEEVGETEVLLDTELVTQDNAADWDAWSTGN
ncbi:ribose transport system substrate-binding protein [Palleronia aestuarii]|uniref:Ribose transport system substrate-binding protein n=1 Tax=Palleronia aestuarii TaxID=568105 RepID=A0A2W7N118_9RHOB|nr:ABC transporter substrate-binding protein [Palleronia aestuarii]PZX13770.1 ribose transport system substrate-binding protein [Palleronia aestuarii]